MPWFVTKLDTITGASLPVSVSLMVQVAGRDEALADRVGAGATGADGRLDVHVELELGTGDVELRGPRPQSVLPLTVFWPTMAAPRGLLVKVHVTWVFGELTTTWCP